MNAAMQPIRLMPGPVKAGLAGAGLALLAICCPIGEAAAQGGRPDASRAAAQGAAGQLAPHRAIYEFTLGKVRSEKGVSALTGPSV